MTSPVIRPTAVVELDAGEFRIISGDVELNSSSVPYAQATIDIPLTTDEIVDAIDPREDQRAILTCEDLAAGTSRVFDLALRGRRVSHDAKKITLTLASDEARLQEYAPLVADGGARAHEASLRDVCDYALDKIGAALEPGSEDADVTARWAVSNLLPDASFEAASTIWANGSGATGFARQNSLAWTGSWAGHWQTTGAGPSFASLNGPIGVRAGTSYVFSGYVRATVANPFRLMIRFEDAAGRILADSYMDPAVSVGGTWTRLSHIRAAPPGSSRVTLHVEYQASASGQFPYIDGLMFHEGSEVVPFFSGSSPTDADYEYDFSGDEHVSVSTRTPIVERLPQMFVWKPGVNAWDFLLPITSAAGMVLWCDELRKWHLKFPESRTLPSLIAVSPANTTRGDDLLSRDDDGSFVTGVVVRYKWRDDDDIDREGYDTAGTSEKVLRIELDQPYPGPGAAQAILNRRQGSGRRQDVTTLVQWQAKPGMTAQITLPGAPDTVGRITSVKFAIPDGLMDLGSSGLVDLIPGSIAALGGTIDDLVGDIDSL